MSNCKIPNDFAPDWTSATYLNQWGAIQQKMKQSAAQSSMLCSVHSYNHGFTVAANAYHGGVLAQNGRIYMVPRGGSQVSTWHYIDTESGKVKGYATSPVFTNNAYYGGVLAPNGRIFMVPFGQANRATWHYINTNTNAVVGYSIGAATASAGAYIGGVLAPNGRIFLIPNIQGIQPLWHYIDTTTATPTVVAYSSSITGTNGAYWGGALMPSNNRIYMAPYVQGAQTNWHYIDPTTTPPTVTAYAHNQTGIAATPYTGAVTAPNGNIYFIPSQQANQTKWHYVDTAGVIQNYTHGATVNAPGYMCGALGADGFIYMAPWKQALQTTWHRINAITGAVTSFTTGIAAQDNGYAGVVADQYGKMWLIPYAQSAQSYWQYIETRANGKLNRGILTNPIFNKF